MERHLVEDYSVSPLKPVHLVELSGDGKKSLGAVIYMASEQLVVKTGSKSHFILATIVHRKPGTSPEIHVEPGSVDPYHYGITLTIGDARDLPVTIAVFQKDAAGYLSVSPGTVH